MISNTIYLSDLHKYISYRRPLILNNVYSAWQGFFTQYTPGKKQSCMWLLLFEIFFEYRYDSPEWFRQIYFLSMSADRIHTYILINKVSLHNIQIKKICALLVLFSYFSWVSNMAYLHESSRENKPISLFLDFWWSYSILIGQNYFVLPWCERKVVW